jgi:hypothetical protein
MYLSCNNIILFDITIVYYVYLYIFFHFQVVGAFGACAGAVSVFGNTPIDVVKTRMQGLEASKYKSTLDCFIKIWKYEGFQA